MAKKSPFLVWTPQFWSQDPKKPFPYGALIGELITLKDTPPISSRLGCRWIPPVKKNTSWPISPLYSIYIQKKVRDQNKMSQTHLKSFNGRQWPPQSTTMKAAETPLSSLSPVFCSIFWAILGQKPLRVHHWDVLESISGVLDPFRGHFSQKNWPRR